MRATRTPKLIAALRETLLRVEQTSGVRPDDPALVELKSILHQRVADLELGRAPRLETVHSEAAHSDSMIRQEPENARSS